MDALRDWGHAKDYVRMQWLMLQQDEPEDFVIATGEQISVRDFVQLAAGHAGMKLEFSGDGTEEVATVAAVDKAIAPAVDVGDVIVRVDPRYFRPAEVQTLLGDASRAKQTLGWEPHITVDAMCEEMVDCDLAKARQHALLRDHGHAISFSVER
jgi:GDPmannose 4,6-dehydratase